MQDTLLFFFDEGRFGLKPTLGRFWAKRGEKVIAKVEPRYRNFYLYSSVSPHTGEMYSLILPWVNTEIMSLYLKKFSDAYADKKILLIMDQAGWHKSKHLEIPDNITIIFLPPYSPELNPVERLWQWLRRHACRNKYFEKEEALIMALCKAIKSLTKSRLKSICRCSYYEYFK